MTDVRGAVAEWRAILGDAHVLDDPETLARYGSATFATAQRVLAVLCPGSADEVRACLAAAAQRAVPVHPISRGCNWGLGSRVPARDAAVMDLARMSAITGFDEDMAWVTVEPGVTFRQLREFLVERRSRLFASATGASPEASVLANALERGDGSGPLGDRWSHVCALEAVLSTGEVVRTGFSRFEGTALAPLHRWGVGPSLDGLFSQSNLAVVTRMTVWLSPLPRSIQALRFSVRDPARLAALVDALRALRLDGTLRASVGLWNSLRVLSTEARFPEGVSGPLDASYADAARPGWEGARWFGLTSITAASEAVGVALREHVVPILAPLVDAWHIEERVGAPVAGDELLWASEPAFGALQGIPYEHSLRSVYWKKSFAPERSLDPDRDRCGVVWSCAAAPFRGRDVARAVAIADAALPAHGFEAMTAVVAPTERAAYVIPMILYDRDEPGADARAMRCHDDVTARLSADGYLPYRLGVHSMDAVPAASDASTAVLRRIKAALDPAGVIAPGRYER